MLTNINRRSINSQVLRKTWLPLYERLNAAEQGTESVPQPHTAQIFTGCEF